MKNKKLKMELVIAVDLDGVIAEFNGWKGNHIIGVPKKGAQKYLQRLSMEGWVIIIYTARLPQDRSRIKTYLHNFGIPFDAINRNINDWYSEDLQSKIYANVYLDDKCINALGKKWNWKKTYNRIKRAHKNYYVKER